MLEGEYEFTDTDERDRWLDDHFPDRQATDFPGVYRAGDHKIRVFLDSVEIIREKES